MRLGERRVPRQEGFGLMGHELQRVQNEDAGGFLEVLDFLGVLSLFEPQAGDHRGEFPSLEVDQEEEDFGLLLELLLVVFNDVLERRSSVFRAEHSGLILYREIKIKDT